MGEIRYDSFWHMVEQRGLTQYMLINEYGFTTNLLFRLRNNKPITTTTICDICDKLHCDVDDILLYLGS